MHHVILERWSRGNSPLHHRDARAKIAALLAFLVVIATTPGDSFLRIGIYAAVVIFGMFLAGLPLGRVLARGAVVLPFSLTFAVVTWFAGDRMHAIGLVEKTYLSALAVLLVAGTTPLPELLSGFQSLGAPRVLVSVIQFIYRYLFVISEQAQHMRLAAVSRSGLRKADRRARLDAATGALGVLFARSYLRAGGIHRAMLARGYRGNLPVADVARFRAADAVFAASAIVFFIAVRTL